MDTEFWYYRAGQRAMADIGVTLDEEQYLRDMSQGLGTWTQARAAGIDEQTISRQREVRDVYNQEYLRIEVIEIEGVVDTLAELSKDVRMTIRRGSISIVSLWTTISLERRTFQEPGTGSRP